VKAGRRLHQKELILMNDRRVTAVFAFLAALAAATVGVSHFLMPDAQLHFATGVTDAFFESLVAGSGAFRMHYWSFVVATVALTGVVMGCRQLVAAPRSLLYRVAEVWALVGLSVTAIDFTLMQSKAVTMAAGFGHLDVGARSAVVAIGLPHLDPTGLFGFGLFGLWLAAFSWAARRALGSALAWVGVVGALLQEAVFLGALAHRPMLIDLGAGFGGAVIAPVWSVWLGIVLWRAR
jgi:hypothetical protein